MSDTTTLRSYLEYIRNTGGNASLADFDDDHSPIGPMVRRHIIPGFANVNEDGKLVLTDIGKIVLDDAPPTT